MTLAPEIVVFMALFALAVSTMMKPVALPRGGGRGREAVESTTSSQDRPSPQVAQAAKDVAKTFSETQRGRCPEPPDNHSGRKPTQQELDELNRVGNLEGMTGKEIKQRLQSLGYKGPFRTANGGKAYIKDLGNGYSSQIRVDPIQWDPEQESPSERAGARPHVHKEGVRTKQTNADTYDQNNDKGKITYDDENCPSSDPYKTHIPISTNKRPL